MFCPKCGSQCADGEAFCGVCGNPLNAQQSAPEQPQQPGAADVIGGILGTVLAGQTQTKGRRTKKTSTQKVVERAAGQMASTAAREVTKGIMRGIFGQMK